MPCIFLDKWREFVFCHQSLCFSHFQAVPHCEESHTFPLKEEEWGMSLHVIWMQTEALRKASNAIKFIIRWWDLTTPHSLYFSPGSSTAEGSAGLCYYTLQGRHWVHPREVLDDCHLLPAESVRTLSKCKIPITQRTEHFISPFFLLSYDAVDVLLKERQLRSSALSLCNFVSPIGDQSFIWERPWLLVLSLTANLAMNLTSSASCPVLLESWRTVNKCLGNGCLLEAGVLPCFQTCYS